MMDRIRARLERAERILSPADPLPVIVVRGEDQAGPVRVTPLNGPTRTFTSMEEAHAWIDTR